LFHRPTICGIGMILPHRLHTLGSTASQAASQCTIGHDRHWPVSGK